MKFLIDFKYRFQNMPQIYLLIFLLLVVLPVLFGFSMGITYLGPINADSARYLFSAEAQAQAAIVAIVVTLTLVAIQLSAQSYSSRVITAFVKHRALWLLLFLYGLSISYDLLILSLISENFPYLDIAVGISLFLVLSTIFALFPYTQFVIKKLNSKEIIRDLTKQISEKELLNQINELIKTEGITFESFNEETLVRPITDIIKTSILKKDTVTARDGIVEIKNMALQIISENKFDMKQTQKIMKFFFWHIHEIWEIVSSEKDRLTAKEVLLSVKDILKTNRNTLESISFWTFSTWYYDVFIDLFFNTAKKNRWDEFLKANIASQKELAQATIGHDLENPFGRIYYTLGEIGTTMESGEYPYSHFVYDINHFLGELAEASASKGWSSSMAEILEYITKTSRFLIENKEDISLRIRGRREPLKKLENTAKILIDKDFYGGGWWETAFREDLLEKIYYELGGIYAEKQYGPALKRVVDSLERIGIYVVQSKHKKRVEDVIRTLEYIGHSDCKSGTANIDYIFNAFVKIKDKTPDNYRDEVDSFIKDSTKKLVKQIVDIIIEKDLDKRRRDSYCVSLVQIGRDYGFDRIVRKVFSKFEKIEIFPDSKMKSRFEELKDCYLKAVTSSKS